MLISPTRLRRWFGVSPSGVLHVGAHHAEEFEDYRKARFGPTIWIEGQTDLLPLIREVILGSKDTVIEAVAWSETGKELTFQVTSETQSSSLYGLADHLVEYPQIQTTEERKVTTVRLDEVLPAKAPFDFVTLDIQGAELEALTGMGDLIRQVRWIFTEVNRREMYAGIPLVAELDEFLSQQGFRRVVTLWNPAGWGDALYVRPTGRRVEEVHFALASAWAVFSFRSHEFWLRTRKKFLKLRRRVYRVIDRMRGLR